MTSSARRAAVLGSPIGHSLSPVLHRAAYAELGLTGWSYDRFDVDEAALPGFLKELEAGPDSWAGLSLTMPLKRAVIPLLDGISDTAASVEAVNTLVFAEDGRRLGDNTDIPGMVAALRERGVERVDSAAVLGAGCHRLLRARRPGPDLHRRGHRVRTGPGPRRRDEPVGRAARRRGAHRRLGGRRPRPRRAAGDRHHPGRSRGRPGRLPSRRRPARSSTCSTTRGPPRWPPPGRLAAARSSAGSTCWCTRRSCRWSR